MPHTATASHPAQQSRRLLVLRILLLSLAYVMAGRLSLLLAIPPGFTTGLFLPMGIGLGACLIWGLPLLPGVLLGSSLLNLWVSPAPASWASLSLAVEIALGSTAAIALGWLLIRRYLGRRNDLTDERSIFAFFALGGPIATSLSASWGTLSLYLNDIIPLDNALYTWWTWWVGDTIGVLIATPLMLVLFGEPRWLWRGRLSTVAGPLLASCLVVVLVFIAASRNEQRKQETLFQQQGHLIINALNDQLHTITHSLATLRGLFVASQEVTADEFATFVEHVVIRHKGIAALSWNQRVAHAQRQTVEQQLRQEGAPLGINERNEKKERVSAGARPEYVIVRFMDGVMTDKGALGYDVASNPPRRQALENATDSGQASLSAPLQLVQDPPGTLSALLFLPVYQQIATPSTLSERRAQVRGYTTAIIRIEELIQTALQSFDKGLYDVRLLDITQPQQPLPIYGQSIHQLPPYASAMTSRETLSIGGREWQVSITPTSRFLASQVSLESWFVLAGGLLFCGLLGGFLLLVSGRAQHIKQLVDRQTQELAAILDNASEAILVIDDQGQIEKTNTATAALFDYAPTDLQQRPIGLLLPALADHFKPGTVPVHNGLQEASGHTQTGQELALELSINPMALGERQLYSLIIHDVSARKRMDKLKREFISTVSHELRTPLTSIRGALSLARSGKLGEVPAQMAQLLQIAQNNAERLGRLVNDILDIDKLEFGQLELQLQQLPIYRLLEQALEHNQGYASRYGINLRLVSAVPQPEQYWVEVDSDRLLQVMSNLLSNAIKFSHGRGEEVRVELSIEGDSARVAVHDQGMGIPEEFRARIFQKFAQADGSNTRHHEGTGLGLSICKIIIERLGGTIGFHSHEGQGSCFYFTLPLVVADKAMEPTAKPTESSASHVNTSL